MKPKIAHIKYDVLAVVGFKPTVASLQLLLPLHHRSLGYFYQDGIVQLDGLRLLLQLKYNQVVTRTHL